MSQINLTPQEKLAIIMGQAHSVNFQQFGDKYPEMLAQSKKRDPLPGEQVYKNIEDDPEYQKLKIVAQFRKKQT